MQVECVRNEKTFSIELNDKFYMIAIIIDEVTDTITKIVYNSVGEELLDNDIPKEIKNYTFVL